MPWKPCSSLSAGFRPYPTRVPSSSFHSSDCSTRPGRGCPDAAARRCPARISSHRIAWTCEYVGAVDATNASPGGCTSVHHCASVAARNDLPASWQDFTAVRRFSTTDRAISRCFDHRCTPCFASAHPTGSSRYGLASVDASSRSAARDNTEVSGDPTACLHLLLCGEPEFLQHCGDGVGDQVDLLLFDAGETFIDV